MGPVDFNEQILWMKKVQMKFPNIKDAGNIIVIKLEAYQQPIAEK